MYFFQFFWSLLERYPPRPCIFQVKFDKGYALHANCIVLEIKCIM